MAEGMSHACRYVEGECNGCAQEAADDTERMVRSWRGRWMVVDATGFALRRSSLAAARGYASAMRDIGIRAHVRRWRRRDARYVGGGFEVTRSELRP